ncbi:MAG: hypothetical protein H8F28_21730 [Fibrella sp.]|nr:hypothetical protein [Armatimonadota bacterium]
MADNIQHGIDDNPSGDAEKGAALGGIGGAITGLAAGSIAGPVGAVLGAVIGGVAGAAASGAAVAAVDRIDNDNTVSGLGGTTHDLDADDNSVYNNTAYSTDENGARYFMDADGNRIYTDETGRYYHTHLTSGERTYVTNPTIGNGVPGIQTGGYTSAGTPDSRGIMEKTADTITGDAYDDKQGVPVAGAHNSGITGVNRLPGEEQGSLKTGGYANDGTPDTRGVGEKVVDGITGDVVDDKTGKVVDHR